ncbi:hypothetical protein BV898_14259 [Hypsibius exemplaris]|uniref:Uncharacterized protein n=1 Tax=Hypsibius exemplaris TaxID=2072580 RepID=A0A1W0W8D2_HYPEX|nr:hypothetical protein BV898_14259 [Hypsibius exemplaris]
MAPKEKPAEASGYTFSPTEAAFHAKPLTYSLERAKEPTPPSFSDLLEDLAGCGPNDPVFKSAQQNATTSAALSMITPRKEHVDVAHIALQVQVAAKNLAELQEKARIKCENFKQSLGMFKEDLEDEDMT